jgi:hypothetical protein
VTRRRRDTAAAEVFCVALLAFGAGLALLLLSAAVLL